MISDHLQEKNSHPMDFVALTTTRVRAHTDSYLEKVWERIAPVWPLENIVATNPLQGYQHYHFNDAVEIASGFNLDARQLPQLSDVNRETIKWAQVLFDNKHATLQAPEKEHGILHAFINLVIYDKKLHPSNKMNNVLIAAIRNKPKNAIVMCLDALMVPERHQELFLSLMLTTLPGWAGYVKYLAKWHYPETNNSLYYQYLAVRLIITTLLWKDARVLIDYYYEQSNVTKSTLNIQHIEETEQLYVDAVINHLHAARYDDLKCEKPAIAQFVFCIDVRSEKMRRIIESKEVYETFGYAGFFGIPLALPHRNSLTTANACPPFVRAKYSIEPERSGRYFAQRMADSARLLKYVYQSLKYSFNTPFLLVDFAGIFGLVNMFRRAFTSGVKSDRSRQFSHERGERLTNVMSKINFSEKCQYAEQFLLGIGLTGDFANEIIICGHESESENNAYASSIDCGACGGMSGALHARILSEIMNDKKVRSYLRAAKKIYIPSDTIFYGGVHITTTNEIKICASGEKTVSRRVVEDMKWAGAICRTDGGEVGEPSQSSSLKKHRAIFSNNWAQVRPEWGLINNAAFVIGPRGLTKSINLESRAFLHSYDWSIDDENQILSSILSGPVRVAFWISMTYLFSALDNQHYGAGSKVTHNITGKQSMMQGNASDIQLGLPMQSLFDRYDQVKHNLMRLKVFIMAPLNTVLNAVISNKEMALLVRNEWIHVYSLDPSSGQISLLSRFFEWSRVGEY